MVRTTSAGRLASLLADAASQVRHPQQEKRPTGQVWAEMLRIEYQSVDYISLMSEISVLILNLIKEVDQADDEVITEPAKKNYTKRLEELLKYFQTSLPTQWQHTYNVLHERNIGDIFNLDSQLRSIQNSVYDAR